MPACRTTGVPAAACVSLVSRRLCPSARPVGARVLRHPAASRGSLVHPSSFLPCLSPLLSAPWSCDWRILVRLRRPARRRERSVTPASRIVDGAFECDLMVRHGRPPSGSLARLRFSVADALFLDAATSTSMDPQSRPIVSPAPLVCGLEWSDAEGSGHAIGADDAADGRARLQLEDDRLPTRLKKTPQLPSEGSRAHAFAADERPRLGGSTREGTGREGGGWKVSRPRRTTSNRNPAADAITPTAELRDGEGRQRTALQRRRRQDAVSRQVELIRFGDGGVDRGRRCLRSRPRVVPVAASRSAPAR